MLALCGGVAAFCGAGNEVCAAGNGPVASSITFCNSSCAYAGSGVDGYVALAAMAVEVTDAEAAQARPMAIIKWAIFMSSPGQDDATRMMEGVARVSGSEGS